jgi:hypothetical protein
MNHPEPEHLLFYWKKGKHHLNHTRKKYNLVFRLVQIAKLPEQRSMILYFFLVV